CPALVNASGNVADHDIERLQEARKRYAKACVIGRGRLPRPTDWWSTEPDVGRVANGVPARVDRLRGLGNAVVPQVAEYIGRQILGSGTPGAYRV
ncbi:MAG: hypothetical protein ACYSWP_16420, partial [Planctomycetota bacterium]